jgi:hypothetical protein
MEQPGNAAHPNWRKIARSAFFWGLTRWLLPVRLPGGLERLVWRFRGFRMACGCLQKTVVAAIGRGCEGKLSADTKPSPCNLPTAPLGAYETDRADLDVRGTREGPHRCERFLFKSWTGRQQVKQPRARVPSSAGRVG